jgi:hypothetical protein
MADVSPAAQALLVAFDETQLAEMLATAQAALAQLHEGEEPYPDIDADAYTEASPTQWIWLWNRVTPAKRLEWAKALMEAGHLAARCSMADHEGQLNDARNELQAVNEILRGKGLWNSGARGVRDLASYVPGEIDDPEMRKAVALFNGGKEPAS